MLREGWAFNVATMKKALLLVHFLNPLLLKKQIMIFVIKIPRQTNTTRKTLQIFPQN